MRLRNLKRKYARGPSYVWPPAWGEPSGLRYTPAVRREGVLVSVRRIGHRLSLTLRLNRQDYVALLDEWRPPPTIDAVEAALRAMIGRPIQEIEEAEVGPVLGRDEHGY
jgi:hypothetical protein